MKTAVLAALAAALFAVPAFADDAPAKCDDLATSRATAHKLAEDKNGTATDIDGDKAVALVDAINRVPPVTGIKVEHLTVLIPQSQDFVIVLFADSPCGGLGRAMKIPTLAFVALVRDAEGTGM